VRALRAGPLEGRSLAEALRALTRRFTADTGVRVRVEVSDVGAFPAEVESELFRIASEALTNVQKHARAREAWLRLQKARGRVQLIVGDSGVGFRPRGARRRGFGLLGMEDRARLVGGRATIRSAPGRGTTVTVAIPIPTT
jgi:two-component system NarL family sensor kinase